MTAAPSARYLSSLLRYLGVRELRTEARSTLVAMGDRAFSFLAGALTDIDRPHSIRRHLPRTIMRFDPKRAADVLLEQLPAEEDGVVRYKILRALTQLRAAEPNLPFDRGILNTVTDDTLTNIFRLLAYKLILEEGTEQHPERKTQTHGLLVQLLGDKIDNALERLFMMLGLRYPGEDMNAIFRGLTSNRANVRASSRELIEHRLDGDLQAAVLAAVDDGPVRDRLEQAGPYSDPALFRMPSTGGRGQAKSGYEDVLAFLLTSGSVSLQNLAVYHVEELGLSAFKAQLEELGRQIAADGATRNDSYFGRLLRRAVDNLSKVEIEAADVPAQ